MTSLLKASRTVAIALLLGIGGALTIDAPAAQAAPCGYYNAGMPSYNHCGKGRVKIRVDKIFGHHFQCVGPGITRLALTNTGNAIKNAYYVGRC